MSCGCKDKKQVKTAYVGTPYDQQAHEMLAFPKVNVELVAPEKPDTSKPLLEFFAGNAIGGTKPSLPSVWSLATPMRGLSFQGAVPFNMVAFVVPMVSGAALLNDAKLMEISRAVNGYGATIGMPTVVGVDQFWIMRPGEVIDFGRTINGVMGFFAAPWSGLSPFGGSGTSSDQAGMVNCVINSQILSKQISANNYWATGNTAPFQYSNQGTADYFMRTHGPLFCPVLRPHFGPVHTVVAPWTRMPWVLPNVTLVNPNSTLCIPPGTRRMALYFGGGSTSYNGGTSYAAGNLYGTEQQMTNGSVGRVQNTSDLWVYWYGADGNFHRHPSDDLVTTGRGQVSPTHDCEIYDVEKSFQGVLVFPANNQSIGNNVTACTYVFSD